MFNNGDFINMREYIAPYSMLWASGVLLIGFAIILFTSKAQPRVWVAFASIAIGVIAVYFYARPTQTPWLGSSAAVQALVKHGKPVLFEFQSPYCIICNVLKPQVDKAEQEYSKSLLVIRINIQDPIGVELKSIYNYQYTPTFIFIGEQGQESWRTIGNFDEAQLRAEMSKRAQ